MLSSLLQEVAATADDESPLPALGFSAYQEFFETGQRIGYERLYFQRRARLNALAVGALMHPESDVARLADVLWAICDEYTWALPAHIAQGWPPSQTLDLFAAETASALAEIVTGLGTRLDPLVTSRVRAEIDRRVFTPLADPRLLPWEGYANNWEAVCAGAAGIAALLLEDSGRLESILERCRSAMDRFLSGYGADGGCAEGIDYWVYGFGYFVYFAEALREHTGEDLLAAPKVREIAAFPHRVSLGGGAYPPFSDASERPWLPAGLLSRLSGRFGTPPPTTVQSFHDDHCYRWAHLARTLTWYQPATPAQLATSDHLPDLGWVIDRGDDIAFAAKGGHNDEPHNHLDLGSFVLHVRGQSVLTDLGAGVYTRDYFGPGRYTHLHPSARGHSIPLIDGHCQLPGRSRAARVIRHLATEDGAVYDLDLTAAYDVDGLQRLVRRFHWYRTGRLELTDSVTASKPLALGEVLISRHEPVFSDAGVTWAGSVELSMLDSRWAPAVERIETSDHHGRPDTVHRLILSTLAPAGTSAHQLTFHLDRI